MIRNSDIEHHTLALNLLPQTLKSFYGKLGSNGRFPNKEDVSDFS